MEVPRESSETNTSLSSSTGSRDRRSISGGSFQRRLSGKRKVPPIRSKSEEDTALALQSSPVPTKHIDLHASGAFSEQKRRVEREPVFRIPQTPNPKLNSAENAAMYQRIRQTIALEYEVVEVLGSTRTSVVEKVRCLRRGSEQYNNLFALKEIRGRLLLADEDKAAVMREYQIGRRFDHPNLVRYYMKWEIKTAVFFLMDLCSAGSLSSFLQHNHLYHQGHVNPAFWHIFIDIICGLHALHSASLFHLDIKPGNILLSPGPDSNRALVAKLGDFGCCWDPHSDEDAPEGDGNFIAPELIGSFDLSTRPTSKADIYSLGLTMFSALTSTVISGDIWSRFSGGDLSLLSSLPSEVRDVIGSMLALRLEIRPSLTELTHHATIQRAADHLHRYLPEPEDPLNTSFNQCLEDMSLEDDPPQEERVTKKRRKSIPGPVRKDLSSAFNDAS